MLFGLRESIVGAQSDMNDGHLTLRRRVTIRSCFVVAGVMAVLLVAFPQTAAAVTDGAQEVVETAMTPWKAAILGVVEGLTEYLPISSTGHLLVASDLLGLGETQADIDAANTYAIAIQFGAILAVVGLFWRRFQQMILGVMGRSAIGRHLVIILMIACLPAIVLGLLFEDMIEEQLFAPWPIVIAWLVGGIAILLLERIGKIPRAGKAQGDDSDVLADMDDGVVAPSDTRDALFNITYRHAALIGLFQCVAMWPGTSRSLMVILGALVIGTGMAAAVEFSFLLGFVILTGASAYSMVSSGGELIDQFGVIDPLIGLVFAFFSAVVAIKWMITYLQRNGLAIFGWYRLGAAGVAAVLILSGVISTN